MKVGRIPLVPTAYRSAPRKGIETSAPPLFETICDMHARPSPRGYRAVPCARAALGQTCGVCALSGSDAGKRSGETRTNALLPQRETGKISCVHHLPYARLTPGVQVTMPRSGKRFQGASSCQTCRRHPDFYRALPRRPLTPRTARRSGAGGRGLRSRAPSRRRPSGTAAASSPSRRRAACRW